MVFGEAARDGTLDLKRGGGRQVGLCGVGSLGSFELSLEEVRVWFHPVSSIESSQSWQLVSWSNAKAQVPSVQNSKGGAMNFSGTVVVRTAIGRMTQEWPSSLPS